MSNVTDSFVVSIQTAIETLRSSINSPIDQIRILTDLAGFSVQAVTGDTTAGPTASVCRRACLSSLANAIADWQPTSSTDTNTVIAEIVPLYDAEIISAADMGDTNSYIQLRNVRSAVVADLQTRGAALPELLTVTVPGILPSLVLAWQLYADATREPDLLQRNSTVIHPAFFPASFEALSN
jgi:prophage DNA circulation protein